MAARNTFAATRRSHAILKKLREGEGVTIRDISRQFDIQYPQARADLKLLEELYDLHTYRDGRTKVWEMSGVNTIETTVGTVAALELGGVALDIFKHTPYGEAIDELTQEVRRRVGQPYSDHMQRLSSALVLRRTWLPTDPELLLRNLEELLDCIAMRRGLEIEYERSAGGVRSYLLIPRRLIWYQGRLWLQAVEGQSEKLFDVAGILKSDYVSRPELIESYVEEELQLLHEEITREEKKQDKEEEKESDEEKVHKQREALIEEVGARVDQWFEYQSREEEDAYFEQAFGIFASNFEPEEVDLIVTGPWVNYLRRYRLHPSQQNEECEEGLRVRFTIGICPEFKSFVLGMIPDAQIVAPESMRVELQERLEIYRKLLRSQKN